MTVKISAFLCDENNSAKSMKSLRFFARFKLLRELGDERIKFSVFFLVLNYWGGLSVSVKNFSIFSCFNWLQRIKRCALNLSIFSSCKLLRRIKRWAWRLSNFFVLNYWGGLGEEHKKIQRFLFCFIWLKRMKRCGWKLQPFFVLSDWEGLSDERETLAKFFGLCDWEGWSDDRETWAFFDLFEISDEY